MRSSVSTSEWIYLTFNPASNIYSLNASAIFFVRVVIKTLFPFFDCNFVSWIRSSTWVFVGLIIISGSINPVGLTDCSTKTPLVLFNSHSPGVAETCIVCGLKASHSSNFSGRLSIHDGSLKPYSDNVDFLLKSPLYIAPIWLTVTWLSSVNTRASLGKYSKSVGGGSPGFLPDKYLL